MQITLLPPLLPTESVTSVPSGGLVLVPGARLLATVARTTLDAGTWLSLGGRDVPTGAPLPYPAGTSLHLEVVEGGDRPVLRVITTASAAPEVAPPAVPPGPAVSSVSYGLAAALLEARDGPDPRASAAAVARWVPLLVSRGILTPAQGEALTSSLEPLRLRVPPAGSPDAGPAAADAAQALATRVAESGVLLERRLADLTRQEHPAARATAARDLRARLAVLAHLLDGRGSELSPAHAAVTTLQESLLAEQARAAAHLARDGVVDVRVPLHVDGQDAELHLRLRIARDPDEGEAPDAQPWRQARLDITLEGLGRVQVRLGLHGDVVRTEFVVEDAAAADRIEGDLADLQAALEAAGFAGALSRVVIDPVAVSQPDVLPDLPPHHSIVDAHA